MDNSRTGNDKFESRKLSLGETDSQKLVPSLNDRQTFQMTMNGGTARGNIDGLAESLYGKPGEGFSFGKFGDIYGNKDIIAWDPKQMVRDTSEGVLQKAGFFTHRGNEDGHIDYKSTRDAYQAAHLDKLGLPKNIVGAVMRNEQHYYKATDDQQDRQVKNEGTVRNPDGSENTSATIGPAQMQIRNIRRLVNMTDEHGQPTYPFLQHMKNDPVRAALDPKNAALLVGAHLNEIAKDQKQHGIASPSTEQIVYGYNDDVHSYAEKNKRVFEGIPDSIESRAEQIVHPDLKREQYPKDPAVVKNSPHVHHVMEELKSVDRIQS